MSGTRRKKGVRTYARFVNLWFGADFGQPHAVGPSLLEDICKVSLDGRSQGRACVMGESMVKETFGGRSYWIGHGTQRAEQGRANIKQFAGGNVVCIVELVRCGGSDEGVWHLILLQLFLELVEMGHERFFQRAELAGLSALRGRHCGCVLGLGYCYRWEKNGKSREQAWFESSRWCEKTQEWSKERREREERHL